MNATKLAAIKRIGGTLPENISPAEHIKQVAKRVKETTPKLALEEREAVGLLGAKERKAR
jgi:DNA-damage-inducible protein D